MTNKLMIFDLDGTIADTIYSLQEAINMTMDAFGHPHRSYEDIRIAIGIGARHLVTESLPEAVRTDEHYIDEVLSVYQSNMGKTYDHLNGCYEGVAESIRRLKQEGAVLAVLSNKPDLYTQKIIAMLFPDMPFSFVQGQTDLPRKPDPTVPLMIAEQFGIAPSLCCFVGDSEFDMETALNAGMIGIGCAWGYRGEEVLRQAGAHHIAKSGWELYELCAQ
ncbi:MAG: HAD family hydrolase [Clostridia bacterium]|nr:HAD family hydrolase [Clostridia bacterium]